MDTKDKIPVGGVIYAEAPVSFNEGRPVTTIKVRNTGDRPIQVGSHFHFFEVNRALEFDRAAAYGMRLNIASTTASSIRCMFHSPGVMVVPFVPSVGPTPPPKNVVTPLEMAASPC